MGVVGAIAHRSKKGGSLYGFKLADRFYWGDSANAPLLRCRIASLQAQSGPSLRSAPRPSLPDYSDIQYKRPPFRDKN